jgi:hypothetical protein
VDISAPLTRLWLVAATATLLITAAVLVTSDASSTVPAVLPAVLIGAVSLGAVGAVAAVDRNFAASPPADDAAARIELRLRAYGQLAVLEFPLLLGVAAGFLLGPPWIVVISAVGVLASLAMTWPTRSRLARFDAVWQAAGHDVSLRRATDGPGPR